MKSLLFFLTFFLSFDFLSGQSIGVGTTSPSASAKLDVSSTTQGFLPPRLTIAQRNSIPNPAVGLVLYCSDCFELEVFDGANWKNMNGNVACVSPTFPFMKICDQIWMTKNLDVSKYRNGDNIPHVTDPAIWASLTFGAWCWYNNDSATYATTYGKLYNWAAVNDPRGLAPQGWHVPSDSEWIVITTCLSGSVVAGGKMKETGTTNWQIPNTGADNSSGFAGLPGGLCYSNGIFYSLGIEGYFWSSTEVNTDFAWSRSLTYNGSYLGRSGNIKTYGFSVRCLQD